jgi:hypothetical protein
MSEASPLPPDVAAAVAILSLAEPSAPLTAAARRARGAVVVGAARESLSIWTCYRGQR